ncbi:5998_t:CDS:1, partial [Racocetra persica]
RTKLNVRDADATLIILLNSTTSHGKGTDFTMEKAKELHKPLKIIYLDNDLKKSVENVVDWIFRNRFDSLNVAGPRESHYFNVHIHDLTREFITKLLVKIESKVQQEQRLRANLQVSS